ncbi:MAG: VOC family protein [Thermoplasmata archaeon]|nr:VOC family protein [Thermoplasmata archaeon]
MTRSRGTRGPHVRVESLTPFLWFTDQAEAASKLYVATFANSRITAVRRVGPGGEAMVVEFELDGLPFVALNGGPTYRLTPAFSVFVSCATQREVDVLWSRLVRGGRPSRCGWLVDRFGLSWQIIPKRLPELLSDEDPERARRAMAAMMKMQKIVIRTLERAVDG